MNRYNYNKSDFDDDDDAVMATVQRIIEGALFICCILLIVAVMQNRDLEDQVKSQKATAAHHKKEATKYSGLLAECLNGGAMVDKASDTAFFCNRPLELKL